jgi:hypothetical protein
LIVSTVSWNPSLVAPGAFSSIGEVGDPLLRPVDWKGEGEDAPDLVLAALLKSNSRNEEMEDMSDPFICNSLAAGD